MKQFAVCTAFAVSILSALAQPSAIPLTLDKTIQLPKVIGRIDHMAVDVAGQRLFVAALGNNTVEVVDLKAGKVTQSLPGFAEPQGIAFVPESNRICVANGQDGTLRILDGRSLKLVQSVALGDDADNVRYDEVGGRVYVGYGNGALAVLDAKSGAKVNDIKLAAHPESFRLESDGPLVFVNIPKADEIAVIDRAKGSVVSRWPMKDAKANFPMILDERNHRVFVGCRNPARLLVLDSSSGKVVTSLGIGRDTDDLFFDAKLKRLYVSCGEGVIDAIEQRDPDHYALRERIQTRTGARTSLFSAELNQFYLAVPKHGDQEAEIRVYQPQD